MKDATAVLAKATGKAGLPYVQFPAEGMRQALLGMGCSPNVADLFVEMVGGFNDGSIKPTEARNARNTTPTTLEQMESVYAAAYKN
jgi:hypothetical protein